jgi:hypothetical protein
MIQRRSPATPDLAIAVPSCITIPPPPP